MRTRVPQTAKSSKGQLASQDQAKQIEELKKKLAASEEKVRDYGEHTLPQFPHRSPAQRSYRHREEAGRAERARVRQARDRVQ